ncbi:MAG: hypothetical protein ACRESC_05670, partial [Gammaproteobacteria bacterium]
GEYTVGLYRVRVIYFGPKENKIVSENKIKQITHDQIADFLITPRASCYVDQGINARSAHNQWHPMVKAIWKIADPKNQDTDKKDKILKLLQTEKQKTSTDTN